MTNSLQGLEQLFGLGAAVGGLLLAAVVAGVALTLWRSRSMLPKRAKGLPKHKVPWESGEAAYEQALEGLYQELWEAIRTSDAETLEAITYGPPFQYFKPRLHWEDRREVLQGSIRESWDPATQRLSVVLAVSRFRGGWKRFYERWTIQRGAKAWSIVSAAPAEKP